jgi:hypothetical protein
VVDTYLNIYNMGPWEGIYNNSLVVIVCFANGFGRDHCKWKLIKYFNLKVFRVIFTLAIEQLTLKKLTIVGTQKMPFT